MAFLVLGMLISVVLANVSGAINEQSRKICGNRYSVTCLKLEIVSFLEKISDQHEYSLLSGVSVVKEPEANATKTSEIIAEVSRIFPSDPNKRLDEFLLVKLNNYLKSHSLRLKLMDNEALERARDLFQGRKEKLGKKGGLEAIIAAAMMMKGMLGAIAFGALAMIAGKALMTGMLAMTIAGVIGLKSLAGGSGGGHKSTTYEIVAKPMYSHSHSEQDEVSHGHTGYGGSWGRSQRIEAPEYYAPKGV